MGGNHLQRDQSGRYDVRASRVCNQAVDDPQTAGGKSHQREDPKHDH